MLSSAKAVLEQKDDQTKVDNAAESLNKAIEGLKKKESVNPGTTNPGTSGTGTGSTGAISGLSLIHISEPTRLMCLSRMPSSA